MTVGVYRKITKHPKVCDITENIDCDIADSLQKIAYCYMDLKKFVIAKDYFKQSLVIYKQVSHDIDTSNYMEAILRLMNTATIIATEKI